MITSTQPTDATSSELDWLLVHINDNVDWLNPFKQEEFAKLRSWVAEATMQPPDCVTVDPETDGGRLYNKLRIAAKEERSKEVQADIAIIQFEKFKHLPVDRARALATLEYAKRQHADRASYSTVGPTGAVFYGSSPERVQRALDAHNVYRKRIRVSLTKATFR